MFIPLLLVIYRDHWTQEPACQPQHHLCSSQHQITHLVHHIMPSQIVIPGLTLVRGLEVTMGLFIQSLLNSTDRTPCTSPTVGSPEWPCVSKAGPRMALGSLSSRPKHSMAVDSCSADVFLANSNSSRCWSHALWLSRTYWTVNSHGFDRECNVISTMHNVAVSVVVTAVSTMARRTLSVGPYLKKEPKIDATVRDVRPSKIYLLNYCLAK